MPTFTLIPDPTAPIFKISFTPDPSLPVIISGKIITLPSVINPFNFQISWTTSSLVISSSWTAPQNSISQSYTITFLQDGSTFQVLTTNNSTQSTTNTLVSGATYTATLFAFTQFDQSPTITTTSLIPLTATPTVTVSWTTGNSYVTCSWVSLTGAINYTIIFLQNSGTIETLSGVSGTSQNSSVLLVSGATYSATVMATNTYGNSPVGTGTITVPLTATPSVTISWASGNGYVTCSWVSLSGATTYTVAFIQNSSAFQTDSGLTGTFQNSTATVSSGVACTATVIAVNSYGNSPVGTSSNSIIPLTAVSTVSLSWSTGNLYVSCSWTSLTGAVTYTISFIQNSTAFQTIAYATGTSINSAITLTPGVACTATVVAVNIYGTSPIGTSSAVVPLTAPPSSVTISWTSGNSYLTSTWSALTGAISSSYTIIFLQNGSTFQTFTNVSETSQNSSTTLTSGAYYTVNVTGANSYGTSVTGSNTGFIVPLTSAPTSITLTYTAASGSMNCSWVAASGAFYYTVAFLQSGSAFQTLSTVLGTSQKSSTALTAGLTYTVTVIALNSYGNSPTGSGGNSAPAGSSMSGLSLSFSSATATMSWTAYSGVSGGYTWILYQNASNSVSGGTINAYGTTSSTSVTATIYGPNYYYFTVVATTATGTSLLTTSSIVQSTYSSGTPTQPSSIGNLLMWFDASDTASVFQNTGGTTPSTNGTAVALWKDKSGGLRNAVGSTANPVYTTNVQNGLAGILFNSSTLNLPTLNLSPISIFMVGKLAVFSQNIMVSLTGGTGIYLRASGGSAVPTYTSYGIDYGATAYRYTTATAITDLNSHVWSFTLPSTGYGVFTFDGTPGLGNGFTASQIAASSSTASFGCYSQNPTNAAMNGYLNEVIIFNTNISAANQTLMEGYLAWKWGLQANLPAGHTYKSAAPTSGSGAPTSVTGMSISFSTNIATMTWSAYSGSTGYSWVLFQATSSSAVGYSISTGTTSSSTTTATYTGLTTGYYYYFGVYSTATTNSAYGTSTASLFTAVLPTGGSIVFNTVTVSSGTVTITAASNATSYTVYISTSTSVTGAVYSFTTTTTGSAVGFTPSPSLVISTTYYAIVLPTNASGNGSTAFSSGLTINGAVPTGGSITFNGIYSITSANVTITAATNATLYTVYLSTTTSTANSVYSFTTSITGSAIVFSPSLSLSTTYYAIVVASNTFGNGTPVVSSGITTAVPSGGSIVLNSITSTTSGTVTITAASSATLYTVYISTTTSSANSVYSFTTTTTGSAVEFTPSPALSVGTYYAIVVASNTFGNGTPAVSLSLSMSAPTGGSVTLNSISTPTSGTLTITAATNTSLYTVYISTTTSSANSVYSFTTTSTGSTIAFTPSPALSAGTYYAVVVASNSFGNGTAFVSASITKSIPTGGSVTLNSISTPTSGTLTITAATDATLYTVYISTTTSSANSVYSFTTTTTGSTIAFTPSPALISGTYYAVVVPSNVFGNGTAFVSASITVSTPTGGSVTLNSVSLTSGSVTITASTGATSYTVYISTTTNSANSVYSFSTPTTGSAVAFTPSPSLGYGTYYAIILPTNSFGNGSYVASAGVIVMYVLSGSLTFTPAGATGSYGPTLSQCRTAYSGFGAWISNDTFFNMTRAGYQLWTVPSTKSYTIVVNGAFGYNTVGARLTFTTTLTQGHVMALVVGQGGSNWTTTCSNINSGGGGGSYLYNSTTATLLAVAGGGGGSTGGAGGGTNGNPTSTSGYNGYGTYNSLGNAAGGTNGGGGFSIQSSQGASQGGGGGGYTGNGQNSLAGVEGGLSFTNGATGGACAVFQGGQGGFGGGAGAGNYTGGGGGGYSGGGGGWWQTSFVCTANGGGGGGGSYCFTTLTSSGLNSSAQGSITIT